MLPDDWRHTWPELAEEKDRQPKDFSSTKYGQRKGNPFSKRKSQKEMT